MAHQNSVFMIWYFFKSISIFEIQLTKFQDEKKNNRILFCTYPFSFIRVFSIMMNKIKTLMCALPKKKHIQNTRKTQKIIYTRI